MHSHKTNTDATSCATCAVDGQKDRGEENIEMGDVWTSSRAVKNWIGGILLGTGLILARFLNDINVVLWSICGESFFISDVLFLTSIGIGGNVILINGFEALKKKELTISLLMTVAILGSIFASILGGKHIFMEGATLAFLYNVAELLEDYSIKKARGSLTELMELSPETAIVRRNGTEQEVSVDAVKKGETVIIKPGEKIPVDGQVKKGNSSVNEAPITGESLPVNKNVGDEVYAGTINKQGYLEVKATSKASESTISQIIDMVESAEREKTEREKFIEKFTSYYTPAVVMAAITVAAVPPIFLGEPWVRWFIRGITMLVLACPCAFVISTPVSVVSGITSAARNGVLIESGTSLEAMGEVKVIAFDKTGTLTKGELTVTDVIPLNGKSKEEVIRCACGVEERSEHPIAQAIVNHVREKHDINHDHGIEDFEEIRGKGVKAYLRGKKHYAGKPPLMEELGFDLEHVHHSSEEERVKQEATRLCTKGNCLNLIDTTIPRLQREGKTVVLVTSEDKLEGVIAVADKIRPSAKEVIEKLNSKGIKTVMLTGDNKNTAKTIAAKIGIKDYRANLMPGEKVEALKQLSREVGNVAMVGDGVNDAPALAAADVGIAMGAAGTDTALETADIALMKDDLTKQLYLQELTTRTKTVIKENIYASLGVKAALAIGVPLGYVTIALAVLAGDAGMAVGVTGNAMRISGVTPKLQDR